MPVPTKAELEAAATTIVEDKDILHAIVHGASDDPDVLTEGGLVPPIAKVVTQFAVNIEAEANAGYGFGANEGLGLDFCLWDQGTNALRRIRLENGALVVVD